MTATIDHENDDREKLKKLNKNLISYSITLGVTLHAVQSIDVRTERSMASKSWSDVWVGYIHI